MNQPVAIASAPILPKLVAQAGARTQMRIVKFFTADIRNPHTRRANIRAADEFLGWCASRGVTSGGAAASIFCDVGRGARPQRQCAGGHAAHRRHPRPVRLAGDWPGGAIQLGGVGMRPSLSVRRRKTPCSIRARRGGCSTRRLPTKRAVAQADRCMRTVASGTKCRTATTSRTIWPPISTAASSAMTGKDRCFGRSRT